MKYYLSLALVSLVLASCATYPPHDYTYQQANRVQSVNYGFVDTVRPVTVQAPATGAGAVSGAIIGGVAGSHVGGGSGEIVGAVAGVIIGGLIGDSIEKNASRQTAMEYVIHMENGRTIVIVQQPTEDIRSGDRVKIISDGQTTRITRY